MTTLLVSEPFLAEYGTLVARALDAAGHGCAFIRFPDAGATDRAPRDYPRVETALLSRDIRFSPPALARFGEIAPRCPALKWVHIGSSGTRQYQWLPGLIARGVLASTSTGANA